MTRSRKPISKNGNGYTTNKALPHPVKTSHTGSPEQQNRKSYTQTAKEDEWNTKREQPRDVHSLPKSSWQAFSRIKRTIMETRRDSGKSSTLGTIERTTSEAAWHFPKRLTLPYLDEEILSGYGVVFRHG